MLITPLELEDEPLKIDIAFAPGTIDFGLGITQVGELPVEGQADLLVEHREDNQEIADIRVRAHYAADFTMECARCVEPVETSLKSEFDLIFRPQDADANLSERAITVDETEIGYYDKSGLLLEDVVREQVLLSLPGRILCRPDCKGLCPRCGQNLNQGICSCEETPADPRWNALADLAGKLELKH
ncbi:MAG TPA: DUF177 domain-containing protein [Granulicella sp.]